jgi:hypothetical protein
LSLGPAGDRLAAADRRDAASISAPESGPCSARRAKRDAYEKLRHVIAQRPSPAAQVVVEVLRDEQSGRNQLGRARIDANGRLHPSRRTRRIGAAGDARGLDFVCVENVMSAADCEHILAAFDASRDAIVGMFVGFTGGFRHEHAVTRVQSGAVRMTMPSFYSADPRHADRLIHPGVADRARPTDATKGTR